MLREGGCRGTRSAGLRMLIVLRENATATDVERVRDRVHEAGLAAHVRRRGERTVIVAAGEHADAMEGALVREQCVDTVRRIARPYLLASRDTQPVATCVEVAPGTVIGGGSVVVIAGPCCVEDDAMLFATAHAAAAAGAHLLKGGTHHASASPYALQCRGLDALRGLAEARALAGLPGMSEVRSAAAVEGVRKAVDVLQVASHHMQSFDLLREVGRQPRAVLLKRGAGSTIEEWLLAAEYVLSQGNERVVLCEPGVR